MSYEKKLDWIHINGNADNSTGAAIDQIYNHLGHFALTGLLMPLLKKTEGSRIVVLSSLGHTMGKLDFEDLNWKAGKYDTHSKEKGIILELRLHIRVGWTQQLLHLKNNLHALAEALHICTKYEFCETVCKLKKGSLRFNPFFNFSSP